MWGDALMQKMAGDIRRIEKVWRDPKEKWGQYKRRIGFCQIAATQCAVARAIEIEIAPDGRTAGRPPAWTQCQSAQADLAAERPFAPNSFGG
ncbi:hypothetical protein [Candidatus Amarolinea dominans]|uniref:hypothetical protein n=1 Tax=Candidatus Amarolinea dominans TaxID=3140696 RepID=UPI001D86A90F|nr:hypothetical protein [Anaerolineae bacterium]